MSKIRNIYTTNVTSRMDASVSEANMLKVF